jgi:hypothetical protein
VSWSSSKAPGTSLPAREPVEVNQAIRGFVDRIKGAHAQHTWPRGMSRRKKALYLSSPIGLGHARRDLAIAEELRRMEPDLEIEWLAQDPVTTCSGQGRREDPPGQRVARVGVESHRLRGRRA